MQATALIASSDATFAETMEALLQRWGMKVELSGGSKHPLPLEAEIVLLDIRQDNSSGLSFLLSIREKMPEAEIILINRPDNIKQSIAGMQAGAADEIIAPFDTNALKNIISAALRRREERKGKKSLLRRFGEAMTAATFAQAGEFDTAVALLDEQEDRGRSSSDRNRS